MNFEEKVKSMPASEVIMAMVEALTHPPIINVDMDTYGDARVVGRKYLWGLIDTRKEVCFGCAATNTVCQIAGIVFTPSNIINKRSKAVNSNARFLEIFERAINDLRQESIRGYNMRASAYKFATIEAKPPVSLVTLKTNYTNEDLVPYKLLAEAQKQLEDRQEQEPHYIDE